MRNSVKLVVMIIVFSLCFVFSGCSDILNQSNNVRKQIDSNGGVSVVLTPQIGEDQKISTNDLNAIKVVLNYRLASMGLFMKVITIDEAGSIIIDFAYTNGLDLSSIQSKIDIITKVGLLTVQEIDEDKKDSEGNYLPTHKIIFNSVDIKDVSVFEGQSNGYDISMKLTDIGSSKLEAATERLIGKPLGIFMDDQLITAPMIQEKISGGNLVISGNLSKEEALNLSNIIKPGPLPTKLIVSSIKNIMPKK